MQEKKSGCFFISEHTVLQFCVRVLPPLRRSYHTWPTCRSPNAASRRRSRRHRYCLCSRNPAGLDKEQMSSYRPISQHVMAQTAPLKRLLAFYDQFIKDHRGRKVSAHWFFCERTNEREVGYKLLWWCLPPQLAVKQRKRRRHWSGISTTDAASSYNTTVVPVWRCRWYSPSIVSRIVYWIYTRDTEYTAETLCKLKCKIKHIYQGTLKLNFSFW